MLSDQALASLRIETTIFFIKTLDNVDQALASLRIETYVITVTASADKDQALASLRIETPCILEKVVPEQIRLSRACGLKHYRCCPYLRVLRSGSREPAD